MTRVIGDTLRVTGAVDLDSTLNVDGNTTFNAEVTVKPGSAADIAKVGGILYVSTTAQVYAGGSTSKILDIPIPANTLAVDGQSFWFEISGIWASGVNVGNNDIKFGGVTLITHTISGTTAISAWHIRGRVYRTGAATQIAIASAISGQSSTGTDRVNAKSSAPTATLSSVNNLEIWLGSGSGAVTLQTVIVGWDPVNT